MSPPTPAGSAERVGHARGKRGRQRRLPRMVAAKGLLPDPRLEDGAVDLDVIAGFDGAIELRIIQGFCGIEVESLAVSADDDFSLISVFRKTTVGGNQPDHRQIRRVGRLARASHLAVDVDPASTVGNGDNGRGKNFALDVLIFQVASELSGSLIGNVTNPTQMRHVDATILGDKLLQDLLIAGGDAIDADDKRIRDGNRFRINPAIP